MTISLSIYALFIIQTLQQAGFDTYLVGGEVRDLLLDALEQRPTRSMHDYDFTTNAKPEEIQALFPEHFYENNFGTVSVAHEHLKTQAEASWGVALPEFDTPTPSENRNRLIDVAQATKIHISLQQSSAQKAAATSKNEPTYQITTYRSQEVYDDHRKPTSMVWGTTLQEDLNRRDFTFNAMAVQVKSAWLEQTISRIGDTTLYVSLSADDYTLIDPYNGWHDLQENELRAVGDPTVRFEEDALRMLRAIRFAVQLNVAIADDTFAAIETNSHLIRHISAERIRDEIIKMLSSDYPAEAIELLDQTGLLQFIMPELLAGKGVQQGGHHTTDVWTHSLDALRYCPSPDPIVRLATLLHDIAKPQTQRPGPTKFTFYNHELIGARVAKKIADHLRLSRIDCERIFTLVRYHMFYYQPHNTDASIRRFMRQVGLENIDDILDLREGDRLGSGARKTSWRLEELKARMIEQLHQPMAVTDLVIDGSDLMKELRLKPGPEIGRILRILFEEVLEQPELNDRQKLLSRAQAILSQPAPSIE